MIIVQTPLRIGLAGGGTDLRAFYSIEPGMVLNMTIDKYIFVIVKERFDDKIYINYSKKEIRDSVDEIQHELVREAMRITGVESGIEITTLADIPSEGSGLGSSSSVTVGLLNALYMYKGEQVTAERLAREACRIEIELCGKPIGKQDQYIAAYGGMRLFKFNLDESVEVERLPLTDTQLRKIGSNLLLFYTGKTRKSEEILSEQRAKTKEGENIEYLRKIKELVIPMREAILRGEYDAIGELLHLNWMYKRRLASKITDPKIDELYERALAAGALGGKISGAGGGGFLLLYVPRHKQDTVREELSELRELPFLIERDGSKVIFNMRRYPSK
ncbi:GHMP kinase [Candidatus Poribacteria bacterium]|nr:GHMP kinase [Candidatus Poribacteria bacterium]